MFVNKQMSRETTLKPASTVTRETYVKTVLKNWRFIMKVLAEMIVLLTQIVSSQFMIGKQTRANYTTVV